MSYCSPCTQNANNAATRTDASIMYRPKAHWRPKTWLFIDEKQNKFEQPTLELIVAEVTGFRHENKLPPIPYLNETITHFTMLSDDSYAPNREAYQIANHVKVGVAQYVKGALAFASGKFFKSDEELFVPKEQAERRALRCLNCPFNQVVVNGRTRHHPSLAQSKFCSLKGARSTSVDGALHLCAKCTCDLACKVHFTPEFIVNASTEQTLENLKGEWMGINGKPMKCWIPEGQ